jgi:hypothetical protein
LYVKRLLLPTRKRISESAGVDVCPLTLARCRCAAAVVLDSDDVAGVV